MKADELPNQKEDLKHTRREIKKRKKKTLRRCTRETNNINCGRKKKTRV